MDDFTGQCLGNYRLLRLLGRGGFANVYLGEHLRLGTRAAIKLLSTHLTDTDQEQFLAEARTLARLEHPSIIRILDFAIERNLPFLVMSYAPNGTLRQQYPKGTRLPPDIIRNYLQQAANALQCAHDAKLVHRDIKPENMLLGRYSELLLSDFGIAIMAHNSRSQSIENIAGTLSYMAPEQIQGKPRPASDQYALAVLVYEWLCGSLPFQGTTAEIAAQHLHAEPPSLRPRVPDLPPTVEAVIQKALAKDPHQRFATVQEFAIAFEEASPGWPRSTTGASSALVASPTQILAPFSNAPTWAESKLPELKSKRHGIPRRALVLGSLGALGLVATGGALTFWEVSRKPVPAPGSTLVTYTGHQGPVVSVAWSPESTRIVSGSDDTTVQLWSADSGADPLIYHGHSSNVNAVAWSPSHSSPRIASASGNAFFGGEHVVQIWTATSGAHLLTYKGHTKPPHTVAWSPDGLHLASGGEDNTVQVWESVTGKQVASFTRHSAQVSSVAWSPDGARLASASWDKTVQIWDARTAALNRVLTHTNTVNAVAWSPDGTRLASAGGNAFFGGEHVVQVWNVATGASILTYRGHANEVGTVAWSPDGARIASASATNEKTVHVWDATTGSRLFTYSGHTLSVRSVAWSPDGTRIVSSGNDGTARVWLAP